MIVTKELNKQSGCKKAGSYQQIQAAVTGHALRPGSRLENLALLFPRSLSNASPRPAPTGQFPSVQNMLPCYKRDLATFQYRLASKNKRQKIQSRHRGLLHLELFKKFLSLILSYCLSSSLYLALEFIFLVDNLLKHLKTNYYMCGNSIHF